MCTPGAGLGESGARLAISGGRSPNSKSVPVGLTRTSGGSRRSNNADEEQWEEEG